MEALHVKSAMLSNFEELSCAGLNFMVDFNKWLHTVQLIEKFPLCNVIYEQITP